MGTVECFALSDGRMMQFVCGHSLECCGTECCPSSSPFYTHWYFWLAVCMFLLVLIGFGVSACRHFRKERKRQCRHCCVMRPKREIGVDLLLNYHMMRTSCSKPQGALQRLPLYEDVVASQHPLLATGALPVTLLPPPPAYTISNSNNISGAVVISNNGNTSPPERNYPNHPPPPYYQLCVVQEEEEEEVHSVLSPPDTADMT